MVPHQPLSDLTNRLGYPGGRLKPQVKPGAKPVLLQPEPAQPGAANGAASAAAHEQQEPADQLSRSLSKVNISYQKANGAGASFSCGVDDGPSLMQPKAAAAAAQAEPTAAVPPPPSAGDPAATSREGDAALLRLLGAAESCTSTLTATPTAAAWSEAGGSTQLASPLAAFAAAKARLLHGTSHADRLIASTLRALDSRVQRQGGEGDKPGNSAAGITLACLQQGQELEVTNCMPSGSGNRAALTVLERHNTVLKERLHGTMALCRSLHDQNRESLGLVAVLQEDNRRLSSSLQEARLDKTALQQTIRQLTREAALLAEQAKRVLLPGQTAAGGKTGAPPAAQAAATLADAAVHAPAAAGAAVMGSASVAAAKSVPLTAAGRGEQAGLSLVRDWSLAVSNASSCGSGGSARLGACWQPGTSVRSFDCSGSESGSDSGGICGEVAAAAPVAYVHQGSGGSGSFGGSGAGDKRRRLAPGMLAHCLRPAIAEAVAEAAAMDAGCGGGASASRRSGTPGRTPKRKHRQMGVAGVGTAAGPAWTCATAAAPDAATPKPTASSPGAAAVPRQVGFAGVQLAGLFESESEAAGRGGSQGLDLAAPTCSTGLPLAAGPATAGEEGSEGYLTFELFESKWHGSKERRRALLPASSGADRRRGSGGCRVM